MLMDSNALLTSLFWQILVRIQVQQNKEQATGKMLVLVDAIAHSGQSTATALLVQRVLMAEEGARHETLVRRVLHHLSTGLPPSEVRVARGITW